MTAPRRRRRRISVESVTSDGQLLVRRSGSKLNREAGAASEEPTRLSPAAIKLIELIVRDLVRLDEIDASATATKE
jgi:hypothetical protein